MFGHDDNGQQPATDAQASQVVTDANMDVTTAGADAGPTAASFGAGSVTAPEPAEPVDAPEPAAEPVAAPAAPAAPAFGHDTPAPADAEDLLAIKQQALQQLSPLVGHLDQTPEEKFRTTMMMIQASDNQDLIKDAYAAANAIEDEKLRAQALLDIINEINYFTQQHQ
jgi:hypothetical protein